MQGLRTLILGSRILDEETYHAWDAEYQVVAGSLSENQEDELNRMAEKLERDLELVGLTAIEDKLQVLDYISLTSGTSECFHPTTLR